MDTVISGFGKALSSPPCSSQEEKCIHVHTHAHIHTHTHASTQTQCKEWKAIFYFQGEGVWFSRNTHTGTWPLCLSSWGHQDLLRWNGSLKDQDLPSFQPTGCPFCLVLLVSVSSPLSAAIVGSSQFCCCNTYHLTHTLAQGTIIWVPVLTSCPQQEANSSTHA